MIAAIAAVPSAVGAVWGIVQIADKLTNAPLNRRKLKAEVEKLERENLLASRMPDNDPARWLHAKRAIRLPESEEIPKKQNTERKNPKEKTPPNSVIETTEDFRRVLRIRKSDAYYDQVANRLERSSIRITELEIEVVVPTRKREAE